MTEQTVTNHPANRHNLNGYQNIQFHPLTEQQLRARQRQLKLAADVKKINPQDPSNHPSRLTESYRFALRKHHKTLFLSNIITELNQRGKQAFVNTKPLSKVQKKKISRLFEKHLFSSASRDAALDISRDFSDTYRLKRPHSALELADQIMLLGSDRFVELHQVTLTQAELKDVLSTFHQKLKLELKNSPLTPRSAIDKLKIEIQQDFLKHEINEAGQGPNRTTALSSKKVSSWERMTSLQAMQTVLAYLAQWPQIQETPFARYQSHEPQTSIESLAHHIEELGTLVIEPILEEARGENLLIASIDTPQLKGTENLSIHSAVSGFVAKVKLADDRLLKAKEHLESLALRQEAPRELSQPFPQHTQPEPLLLSALTPAITGEEEPEIDLSALTAPDEPEFQVLFEPEIQLAPLSFTDQVQQSYETTHQVLEHQSEQIELVLAPLYALVRAIGDINASYLINLSSDHSGEADQVIPKEGAAQKKKTEKASEKPTLIPVTFSALAEQQALASLLSNLLNSRSRLSANDLLEATNQLDRIQIVRLLKMIFAQEARQNYVVPALEYFDDELTPPNMILEMVEHLEHVTDLAQRKDRSSMQVAEQSAMLLGDLIKNNNSYFSIFQNAAITFFADHFEKSVPKVINQYVAGIENVYLHSDFVETLGNQQIDHLKNELNSLWIRSDLQKSKAALMNTLLERSAQKGRLLLKQQLTVQNILSIHGVDLSTQNANLPDMITAINYIIQTRKGIEPGKLDLHQIAIRSDRLQKAFDERGKMKKPLKATEELGMNRFTQLHRQCQKLAQDIVSRENNQNLSWQEKVQDIETQKDLLRFNEICQWIDDSNDIISTLFHGVPELKNIIDILIEDSDFDHRQDSRLTLGTLLATLDNPQTLVPATQTNAVTARLPGNLSLAFSGAPELLTEKIDHLLEVQGLVLETLPKRIQQFSGNLPQQHQHILLPLEKASGKLLATKDVKDPFIKQIDQDIIHLLNHLQRAFSSSITASMITIFARSHYLNDPSEQTVQKLIHNTDELALALYQRQTQVGRFKTTVKNLLELTIPMEVQKQSSIPLQYAQQFLYQSKLSSDLVEQITKDILNQYPLLIQANQFKDDMLAFSNLKRDFDKSLDSLLISLEGIKKPNATLPTWVHTLAQTIIGQANDLLIPPSDPELRPEWNFRINLLKDALIDYPTLNEVDFAPRFIQNNQGVNLNYLYIDQNVYDLLVNMLSSEELASDGLTLAPFCAGSPETLSGYVHDWLDANLDAKEPRAHIIPFSPTRNDYSNSIHWTAIILSLDGNNELNIHFIDPLTIDSEISTDIAANINQIITDYDLKNDTALNQTKTFSPIIHSEQNDATSCGPRIVKELSVIAAHWKEHQKIPSNIQAIEDIVSLRAHHIELLGGKSAKFFRTQLWDLGSQSNKDVDGKTLNSQDRARHQLVRLLLQLNKVNPKTFSKLIANPTLSQVSSHAPALRIDRILNQEFALSPEEIYRQAASLAQEISQMTQSVELIYQFEDALAFDLFELQQKLHGSDNKNVDITAGLREAFGRFYEKTIQQIERSATDKERLALQQHALRVTQPFYSKIAVFDANETFSDRGCQIDAATWVLPRMDLSRTQFVTTVKGAYQIAEHHKDQQSFDLILKLKDQLPRKISRDPSQVESKLVKEQRLKDTEIRDQARNSKFDETFQDERYQPNEASQFFQQLHQALLPDNLTSTSSSELTLSNVHGGLLEQALSEIDLSHSFGIMELVSALKLFRAIEPKVFKENTPIGLKQEDYAQWSNQLKEALSGLTPTKEEKALAESEGITLVVPKRLHDSVSRIFPKFSGSETLEEFLALEPTPFTLVELASNAIRLPFNPRTNIQKSSFFSLFSGN